MRLTRLVAAEKMMVGGRVAATTTRTKRRLPSTSDPRTRLPFLQNVVRKARTMAAPSPARPQFKAYPLPWWASGAPHAATASPHSDVLYQDDQCIVVNDAYPKSSVHCLVMPLDLSLTSLNALRACHVPLLRHMCEVADTYVRFLKTSDATRYAAHRFITGFHAIPSLPMLHMHLLSMDLDSPNLKTKKHYNSFATFFFLTSDRVVADLERHGRVTINQNVQILQQLEEQAMRCLWCGEGMSNMAAMKAHVKTCKLNKSVENDKRV